MPTLDDGDGHEIDRAQVPPVIGAALQAGATLAFSISGGKDGQAMLACCHRLAPGRSIILHADLGRMEWPETPAIVDGQARRYGMPLRIVRRTKGDLLSRMQDEFARVKDTGQQGWPSSQARYCTADQKRDPLVREQRTLGPVVISCQGIRKAESPARSKRQAITIERRITSKTLLDAFDAGADVVDLVSLASPKQRLVLNWLPILDMSLAEVWAACGTSAEELAERRALYSTARKTGDSDGMRAATNGWPCHTAYLYGNSRVSCALCVLATENDLRIGAEHNPDLLDELVALEKSSGQTFQRRLSLASIRDGRKADAANRIDQPKQG